MISRSIFGGIILIAVLRTLSHMAVILRGGGRFTRKSNQTVGMQLEEKTAVVI